MTNRTESYGAFARLLLPREGDPEPRDLLRRVPGGEDLLEILPESLPREHDRAFGHSVSAEAPPYETSYGASHIFMQSHQLADIAGFYKAFGLQPLTGERLDHLAAELEFMQYLAAKETYAKEHAGTEEVDVCRDAQRTFLKEHLGRWVGAFATRMEGRKGSPFYVRLVQEIVKFVREECEALQVEPLAISAAELRVPESVGDAQCGTCDLSKFQ